MDPTIKASAAAAILLGLCSCGGGSGHTVSTPSNSDSSTLGPPTSATETGPATAIVPMPGGTGAAVALFPDGKAFYSPDGFNLGGGGSTVLAYSGALTVQNVVAVNGGVEALLSDGSAYYSPNGLNLGGGGSTVAAYQGSGAIVSLVAVPDGVDAVFQDSSAFFSPDGLNLAGGGTSVLIHPVGNVIRQIVPVATADAADGVVTLMQDGTVYYSPDNRNIAGGGLTVLAAPGAASSSTGLVPVSGGVIAKFADGSVYLSPDGKNLAGGGGTVGVASWSASSGNGPFRPRDSAPGVQFAGHLWLSGGYSLPSYSNSCFLTCSYYELWSSTDLTGAAWNSAPSFVTATTPNPRDATPSVNNGVQDDPVPADFYDAYSPIAIWNGVMFAIGRTIWSSADGQHWTRQNLADGSAVVGPVAIRASENSRALVLGTALFYLQPDTGDVHRTDDPNSGVWTDLGAIPGFTPRCGAAAFVLLGRLWIEGGGACDYSKVYNEVWSSADGVNWTKSAKAAEWPARMWPCVALSGDGVVWLAGGYAPTDWNNTAGVTRRYSANHGDVWYSKDGADWRQFKAEYGAALPDGTTFEPRHAPTCFVTPATGSTAKTLVVAAGTGGVDPNGNNAETLNSIRRLALPSSASLP